MPSKAFCAKVRNESASRALNGFGSCQIENLVSPHYASEENFPLAVRIARWICFPIQFAVCFFTLVSFIVAAECGL